MLQVIYYVGVIIMGVILELVTIKYAPSDVAIVVSVILLAIVSIWGGVLLNIIKEHIKDQLNDLHSLDRLKAEKGSYEAELEAYKTEMQKELLERYREFETTLMTHVKDSKLVAALLQQSGYAEVLNAYNKAIKDMLSHINACDRKAAQSIANMKTRQDDFLAGYGRFIPRRLLYTP